MNKPVPQHPTKFLLRTSSHHHWIGEFPLTVVDHQLYPLIAQRIVLDPYCMTQIANVTYLHLSQTVLNGHRWCLQYSLSRQCHEQTLEIMDHRDLPPLCVYSSEQQIYSYAAILDCNIHVKCFGLLITPKISELMSVCTQEHFIERPFKRSCFLTMSLDSHMLVL